jgi:methionine-rich copper-binding protein CopC
MKRAAIILGLLLAPIAFHSASAHAFLESAEPGAGARVQKPPGALVLSFTAPIEGSPVSVQVYDASGALLASSKDPKTVIDWATITLTLPALKPGTYRVTWRVDLGPGHETEGDYTFAVLGPGP